MFGLSFTEIMLIGVVALIVIGPEKLPKVARTVGHLLGRAQRYVNDVKTDIRKEMDSAEIGSLKDQMQEAAQSVKASVAEAEKSWRAPIDDAQDALKQASESVKALGDSIQSTAATPEASATEADQTEVIGHPETPAVEPDPSAADVDTRTLPLPGFDQKQAPVGALDESKPANKGSQP